MLDKKKYLIVIAGPTGVGKTDVSIEIAKFFNTYIISSDSRQIFKELNIGTAVPDKQQLKEVKHFMIQNHSVLENYNAYSYEEEVIGLLDNIYKEKDVVILVGGSGMYIDAVLFGIDDIPTVKPEIRNLLLDRLQNEGLEKLVNELKELDPDSYKSIELANPHRVLKALEITIQSGKPYSSFLTGRKKERNFIPIIVGLNRDRAELHNRINKRVDIMFEDGLLQEAKDVYPIWLENKPVTLNTVGYKELYEYFEGKISLDEAKELIKRNSRRYARRQITWFKRYEGIKWFNPDDKQSIIDFVSEKAIGKQ